MGYSIEEIRESMPNIGDALNGGIVDYVNKEHLWYRVRRKDGTDESFKLPKMRILTGTHPAIVNLRIKNENKEKLAKEKIKVVQTGKVYETYADAAKDLGCSPSAIRTALREGRKCLRKYTFVKV